MRLWPNPRLAPILINTFTSRDDLIEALVTSSHVPFYLDSTQPLWRRWRGGLYADGGGWSWRAMLGGRCGKSRTGPQGPFSENTATTSSYLPHTYTGLIDLVPPVPGAIKVCVFPPSILLRSDLHVHPHLNATTTTTTTTTTTSKEATTTATAKVKAGFPFSIAQLMRWAFVAPVDDGDVERLYALGQEVRACVVDWLKKHGAEAFIAFSFLHIHSICIFCAGQAALEWLATGGVQEGREIDVVEVREKRGALSVREMMSRRAHILFFLRDPTTVPGAGGREGAARRAERRGGGHGGGGEGGRGKRKRRPVEGGLSGWGKKQIRNEGKRGRTGTRNGEFVWTTDRYSSFVSFVAALPLVVVFSLCRSFFFFFFLCLVFTCPASRCLVCCRPSDSVRGPMSGDPHPFRPRPSSAQDTFAHPAPYSCVSFVSCAARFPAYHPPLPSVSSMLSLSLCLPSSLSAAAALAPSIWGCFPRDTIQYTYE